MKIKSLPKAQVLIQKKKKDDCCDGLVTVWFPLFATEWYHVEINSWLS